MTRLAGLICLVACLTSATPADAQSIAYVVSVTIDDRFSTHVVELHAISTATGNVIKRIQVAGGGSSSAPTTPQVVLAPDRQTAYVTAGDLYVIDVIAGTVQRGSLGTTLGPLALSADGTRLYVADQGGKRVVVVDTATRQLTGSPVTFPSMPSRLSLSADGATLGVLAETAARTLYVVQTALRTVSQTITTLPSPVELSMRPDGSRVYVAHSTAAGPTIGEDTLVAYDTATGSAAATVVFPDFSQDVGGQRKGSRVYQMAVLPSAGKLYAPRFTGGLRQSPTGFVRHEEVVVVDLAAMSVATRVAVPVVTSPDSFGLGAVALPDGSRVVVAGPAGVHTIDTSTEVLTSAGRGVLNTKWVEAAPPPACWAEVLPQRVFVRTSEVATLTFALAEGCPWTATYSEGFFTLSPTSGTGPGTISVTVTAGSEPQLGSIQLLGQTIVVQLLLPHIVIDTPAPGSNVTLPFDLGGWTIERSVVPSLGAPSVNLVLLHDQVPGGAPAQIRQFAVGGIRPDVAAIYGGAYQRSGYLTTIGRLPAGTHTLTVTPRSAADNSLLPAASVSVTVVRQPRVELDSPSNNASVTQPFQVVGWAADMTVASGTGVDTVHLWAQPAGGGEARFLGAATMGISRADVGLFFNEQPLLAGFQHTVTGLPPGRYTVTAYAHYTATGTFEETASRDLFVDATLLTVTPASLRFGVSGAVTTGAQSVRVTMTGPSASQATWSGSLVDAHGILELRPATGVAGPVSGTGAGTFQVALKPGASLAGVSGTVAAVRVSSAGATNAPVDIPVTIDQRSPTAPTGYLDTPTEGASVSGTIAVTGWAVDDVEVTRVAVYRTGTGAGPAVFIGDASFVDGARPDVAALFPNHPRNTRAGWGLSVLTNMLPNQGNGTFMLHAFAYDGDGLSTLLGTRVIHANNATATLPFGTIDVPAQGATVSGSLVIFGWALTPSPGIIPVDGSTIEVLVDGVMYGRPTYNQCRGTNGTNFPAAGTCNDDIATIFGTTYRNISEGSGAIGSFVLDTRTLTNGLHQIQWRVTDSLNRVQGIGSRYIYVQN